jgi:hypothetical protein
MEEEKEEQSRKESLVESPTQAEINPVSSVMDAIARKERETAQVESKVFEKICNWF